MELCDNGKFHPVTKHGCLFFKFAGMILLEMYACLLQIAFLRLVHAECRKCIPLRLALCE